MSVWPLWKGTAPISGTQQSHLGHGGSGATKGVDATLGRGRTGHGCLWRRWGLSRSQNRVIVST